MPCTRLARGLHGLAHGTTERDASLELLGDGLRDEVGVELGALDLDDLNAHMAAGDLLELLAEHVDLGALLADDDARTGSRDDDLDLVAGSLDLHARKGGIAELLLDVLAQLEIVLERGGVIVARIPAAAPILGDAETEACRLNFLTHDPYASSRVATMMVMWLVRFMMGLAEPLARGR